jgi:hypothetical protein
MNHPLACPEYRIELPPGRCRHDENCPERNHEHEKEIAMKTRTLVSIALTAAAFAAGANAQQAPAGGAVLKSEPGKATAVAAVEASALVVAIDKATRTVTLKRPNGEVSDIVAGPDVKNFDQIKVGDSVVVRYIEALSLELRKTKGEVGQPVVREEMAKAKPGEKPAVAGGRQVTAIAEVTAVDPAKKTITLKGPRGNSVTLDVQNPEQFKVVKKGDQVEVTYTEALALSVEPAAKAAAPKAAPKADAPKADAPKK